MNLEITVKNKIATANRKAVICDNTDYDVVFTFDDEWTPYQAKTMRVNYSNGTYADVAFTGTTAALPRIYYDGRMTIGVFAGDIHTSTPAVFDCRKSILTDGGQEAQPTPDVYSQIMALINSGMIKGDTGDYIDVAMSLNPETGVLSATYTRKHNDGSVVE